MVDSSHVPVPLSPPRWLRPELVGQLAMTTAAASTTHLLTSWMRMSPTAHAVMMAVATLAAGAIIHMVVRARSAVRGLARAIVGAIAYSMFVIGVLFPATWLLTDEQKGGFGVFALMAIVALLLGIPIGGGLGLLYGIVAALVGDVRERPSHEATARVAWTSAAWLAVVALVQGLVVARTETHAYEAAPMFLGATWIAPLALAAVLLPLGLASSAAHARWLARVREGSVGGWRIAPRPSGVTSEVLPLRAGSVPWACEEVLVRVEGGAEAVGYREAATPEEERVVALV